MRPYQLGIYEKALPAELSWKQRLTLALELGFDHMEMSIDETDDRLARLKWNAEERSAVRAAMEETGCKIRSICLSGHRKYPLGSPDPEIRNRGMEIMKDAIQLAADLGVRIIQLAGYDTYYDKGTEETERWFASNLRVAAEWAAARGVLLGFETMETPFMDTVSKAMRYVREVQSAYLGVYPDIGNLQNAAVLYGVPAYEDIQTGRGHIFAAHLKETIPGHYREIPFGTGHTDYEACIRELKQQGVRLFVGEFWHKGEENWREIASEAARFLREKLEAAFGAEGVSEQV